MELLPLSFTELLEIVFYFSSLSMLIGIAIQGFMLFATHKTLTARMFIVIAVTQLLAFAGTIILWLKWPSSIRILYGPILFPAVVTQLIFVPIVPGFFGYATRRKVKESKIAGEVEKLKVKS